MERTKKVIISFTDKEYNRAKDICNPGQPFSTYVRERTLEPRAHEEESVMSEIRYLNEKSEGNAALRGNHLAKRMEESGEQLKGLMKAVIICHENIDELRRISLEADGDIKLIEKKVDNWGHLGENKFEELLRKQEEVIKRQKANLYWIVSGVSVLILLSILTFLPL